MAVTVVVVVVEEVDHCKVCCSIPAVLVIDQRNPPSLAALKRRQVHKAEKIARERLQEKETPAMLVALGELTQDPECWRRAWDLSGGRYALAKVCANISTGGRPPASGCDITRYKISQDLKNVGREKL